MSELDKIKARLEAAESASRGELDAEATHEVMLTWNEESTDDMALLLAVVDVVRGLNTPRQVIAQWRRIADKTRPADAVLAAQFDEYAEAWEGIA